MSSSHSHSQSHSHSHSSTRSSSHRHSVRPAASLSSNEVKKLLHAHTRAKHASSSHSQSHSHSHSSAKHAACSVSSASTTPSLSSSNSVAAHVDHHLARTHSSPNLQNVNRPSFATTCSGVHQNSSHSSSTHTSPNVSHQISGSLSSQKSLSSPPFGTSSGKERHTERAPQVHTTPAHPRDCKCLACCSSKKFARCDDVLARASQLLSSCGATSVSQVHSANDLASNYLAALSPHFTRSNPLNLGAHTITPSFHSSMSSMRLPSTHGVPHVASHSLESRNLDMDALKRLYRLRKIQGIQAPPVGPQVQALLDAFEQAEAELLSKEYLASTSRGVVAASEVSHLSSASAAPRTNVSRELDRTGSRKKVSGITPMCSPSNVSMNAPQQSVFHEFREPTNITLPLANAKAAHSAAKNIRSSQINDSGGSQRSRSSAANATHTSCSSACATGSVSVSSSASAGSVVKRAKKSLPEALLATIKPPLEPEVSVVIFILFLHEIIENFQNIRQHLLVKIQ